MRLRLAAVALITALCLWQGASMWAALRGPEFARFVPSPGAALAAGLTQLASRDFWLSMKASNVRVLSGFVLAVILALPMALLAAAFTRANALMTPVLDFARFIPVPAMVPITILWIGVADSQKILILCIGTFFQLFVLMLDALQRVPTSYVDCARVLGRRRSAIVLRVMLPAAAPDIFDACRVGVGLTWSYLLVAEIVAAERGMGYMIIRSQRFLRMDEIAFVIVVLGLIGLAYDRAFVLLRPRLFPWADGLKTSSA